MSLPVAAIALQAVGTAVGVAGAVSSGNTQKAMMAYQAQVAQNNALIANQNAEYALAAGQQEAATQSLKGAEVMGAVVTGLAASGIDVGSGSAVDVRASQREKNVLDTETVMHNAQLKAYGYRTQAAGFEAEAGMRTAEGAAASRAGKISALSTLLSGASGVAKEWANIGGGTGGTPDTSLSSYTPMNILGYE